MAKKKVAFSALAILVALTFLGAIKTANAVTGWTGTANSLSQTTCGIQPAIVYSPQVSKVFLEYTDTGSFPHCVAGNAYPMHVLVSADGVSFAGPYDVGYVASIAQIADMTYDSDNQLTYLMWEGCQTSSCTTVIWLSSTTDGTSWTTAKATPFASNVFGPSFTYDNGNHRLVAVLSGGTGGPNPNMEIWKSTDQGGTWTRLSDVSYGGTNVQSQVSAEIRYASGVFYLSYTDSGQGIHILQSTDLSTWTNRVDLPDLSGSTPAFSYSPVEALYHIAWQGTDSAHTINDRTSSDAINWPGSGKYVTNQQTSSGPVLGFLSPKNELMMGWTGTDSSGHVNTMLQNQLTNNAQFVSQISPPSTISPGQQASVSVTVKNTGTTVWSPSSSDPNPFRLGAQNPQDNTNWGFSRVDLMSSVAPGNQYTFQFTVTAPSTLGSYGFQWKMVQEGVQWFGDITPNLVVNVVATDFSFSANPSSLNIHWASYGSSTITVTGLGSFSGTVNLSVANGPWVDGNHDLYGYFNNPSLTISQGGTQTTTFYIQAYSSSVPPGPYTFTLYADYTSQGTPIHHSLGITATLNYCCN